MNTPERLQKLVAEAGLLLGSSSLRLDEQGGCALEFDKQIVVSLQYRQETDLLCLYTDLGPAPMRSAQFHEKLLQANFFWQATVGSTFSLSGDEPPHIILAHPVQWSSMDLSSFNTALLTFIDSVEVWHQHLKHMTFGGATKEAIDVRGHDMPEGILRSLA